MDAGEGEGAHEGVVGHLEGQGGEELDVAGFANRLLLRVLVDAGDGLHLHGAGQVIHRGAQQRLYALVLEGGPGDHGHEAQVERPLAQELLERVDVWLVPLQVLHERVLALVHGQLHELLAPLGRPGLELVVHQRLVVAVGQRYSLEAGAQVLPLPHHGLHGHQVNDAQETPLGSYG